MLTDDFMYLSFWMPNLKSNGPEHQVENNIV